MTVVLLPRAAELTLGTHAVRGGVCVCGRRLMQSRFRATRGVLPRSADSRERMISRYRKVGILGALAVGKLNPGADSDVGDPAPTLATAEHSGDLSKTTPELQIEIMRYPLTLRFKTIAVSPQISVTDQSGELVYYVKQKAFKLKEAITVFADMEQTRPVYSIAADRVIDIAARYFFQDQSGSSLGFLQRQGMKSFWRAHYDVHATRGQVLTIREENPWAKVIDSFVGEIPVVGLITGYFFHPAYAIVREDTGAVAMRLVKEPAFLEGRYRIEQLEELNPDDEIVALLSILTLVLLERRRG